MMKPFRAFRINQVDGKIVADYQQLNVDDLTAGEVVIRVEWSNINYKDALAATGAGKILRQYPLNGGIDLAGVVMESTDARYHAGDAVLVCSASLSETVDGGYAEVARVAADSVVPLPAGLTAREAMAIGTAGFTAALALVRMEQNGQTPEQGPIVVTGASGGVGSVAIDLLAARGYQVTAFTGKAAQHDFLRKLGAREFIDRHTVEMGTRPLEAATWGGAVDNAGGDTLAWLTRTVKPRGNIASIGLVHDVKLQTTVMPFILRGVSLLGINCMEVTTGARDTLWARLGSDLKPPHLADITTREIDFAQLPTAFDDYINGQIFGRTVVKIQEPA